MGNCERMDKTVIVKTIVVGPLQTNCYILGCRNTHDAVIIDPGDDNPKIQAIIEQEELKVKAIILTHGHYDHIGCLNSFDLPVYIHADDAEMLLDGKKNLSASFGIGQVFSPDLKILKHNDIIKVGDLQINVIHTPGHSRGGICLHMQDVLFSGDTLFCHGIGPRHSDHAVLRRTSSYAARTSGIVCAGLSGRSTRASERNHSS